MPYQGSSLGPGGLLLQGVPAWEKWPCVCVFRLYVSLSVQTDVGPAFAYLYYQVLGDSVSGSMYLSGQA